MRSIDSIKYSKFLSLLQPDELANYIIEAGRGNGKVVLTMIIKTAQNADASEILSRSFDFHNSIMGHDYWSKIFLRLLEHKRR